uniref:Microtubule-associated protein 6 n=1 Tax=Petromyzon marinus TaxID=7757 RepID=A0AAJ7U0T7_PETMA|nr:microtubule-associated protein 6 [Petromyzon marinus]
MAWPCVNRACCLARCWNQLDVDDISIPLTHATFAEESLLPPANEASAANSGGGHPGPGHPHPHQQQQQGLGVSGGGGDAAANAREAPAPEKPSSQGASRSVTRSDYRAWRVKREPSCKPRREYLPPEDPFSNDTQYKADFRVWPLHRREKPQWGHHHHDQLQQQQQQLLPHQQHHCHQQQQQDSVYTRLLGEDATGRDGGGMVGPGGDGEGEPLVKKHGAESKALLAMAREVCIMPVQATTRPDARQETSPRRKRVTPASSSSPESRRPRTPTTTTAAPRRDLSSRAGPPPARHSRSPGPPPAAVAVEKGGGDGAGAPGGGRGRRGSSRRGRKVSVLTATGGRVTIRMIIWAGGIR